MSNDKVIIKNEEVYCPHCKEYLFEEEFMRENENYKFCPYCGGSITVKEQSSYTATVDGVKREFM